MRWAFTNYCALGSGCEILSRTCTPTTPNAPRCKQKFAALAGDRPRYAPNNQNPQSCNTPVCNPPSRCMDKSQIHNPAEAALILATIHCSERPETTSHTRHTYVFSWIGMHGPVSGPQTTTKTDTCFRGRKFPRTPNCYTKVESGAVSVARLNESWPRFPTGVHPQRFRTSLKPCPHVRGLSSTTDAQLDATFRPRPKFANDDRQWRRLELRTLARCPPRCCARSGVWGKQFWRIGSEAIGTAT